MILKRLFDSFVCLALFSGVASAQVSARVAPPVVGFVTDSTGALRPLIGIARAATVGSPLELELSILQSAVSPDQDYILATAAGTNAPIWLKLGGEEAAAQSLDGVANVRRIAISPAGSAAAFFNESDARISAFANLSRSPMSLGDFDISGPVTSLAIADDGNSILIGISDGINGSVFLLKPSEAPRLIAATTHPSAMQFLRHSAGAIIADDVDNKILSFADGQVSILASAGDGILAPDALGISRDNQKVFVANSKAGSITTIDQTTAISPPVYCNCTLTGLHPMYADSVFRITDFSGGPVLLFDGSSAGSPIVFVPVAMQY